jgi:aminopeptidase-like protein
MSELGTSGEALHALIRKLYPINRSITGNGVRETLSILGTYIPIQVHEVPSGTQVFDWTIPLEWNVREAWIEAPSGKRVVDFANHNLHLVSYSIPIRTKLTLAELRPHLHSLPNQPDTIPNRTSYYKADWGFCVKDRELQQWPDGEYTICVDTTLEPGSLTYGEYYLPGDSLEEVLISSHICHPSLANDNLSGVVIAVALAESLTRMRNRKLSYRFLFAPGTIGAITWLALNASNVQRIKHGLILSGLGDSGGFTYKKSRRGNTNVDRIVKHVLTHAETEFVDVDFSPYGYDERQYCSPGFNLPVGVFSRTPFGTYPEYHTSDDNLDFVKPESLAESAKILQDVLFVMENDQVFQNTNSQCEPHLGRRGLYDQGTSGIMPILWCLNYSDGGHSLLDIAEKAQLPFRVIEAASSILKANGLLVLGQD